MLVTTDFPLISCFVKINFALDLSLEELHQMFLDIEDLIFPFYLMCMFNSLVLESVMSCLRADGGGCTDCNVLTTTGNGSGKAGLPSTAESNI